MLLEHSKDTIFVTNLVSSKDDATLVLGSPRYVVVLFDTQLHELAEVTRTTFGASFSHDFGLGANSTFVPTAFRADGP